LTNDVNTLIFPASGVHNPQGLIDFTVFPNPAKQKLELSIPEMNRSLVDQWMIYDSNGKIIKQSLFQQDHSLNITSLPPGAYNLILAGKGEVIGAKTFVKE
jgi:hypothetical protein